MVCAGEATGLSQSRRSTGLEIGCLIDTTTGLLTFTSSGVEMATFYQVGHTTNCVFFVVFFNVFFTLINVSFIHYVSYCSI